MSLALQQLGFLQREAGDLQARGRDAEARGRREPRRHERRRAPRRLPERVGPPARGGGRAARVRRARRARPRRPHGPGRGPRPARTDPRSGRHLREGARPSTPRTPRPRPTSGTVYLLARDYPRARVFMEEALALDPDVARAHNALGVIAAETGQQRRGDPALEARGRAQSARVGHALQPGQAAPPSGPARPRPGRTSRASSGARRRLSTAETWRRSGQWFGE